MSVSMPSGMMMARAVPTSSPAPSTDTLASFSSLRENRSGAEPAKYEPANMTRLSSSSWNPDEAMATVKEETASGENVGVYIQEIGKTEASMLMLA